MSPVVLSSRVGALAPTKRESAAGGIYGHPDGLVVCYGEVEYGFNTYSVYEPNTKDLDP